MTTPVLAKLHKQRLAVLIASILTTGTAMAQTEPTVESEEHDHTNSTEVIVVTASPLDRNQLNSAQPVSVLSGDELRQKQAHTLGETLATEPGINNTHYANVAGSPIIRGLDGPRVKITQNGLDSADVSRGSPDHAVTTETSVAQQVEILRGPATLLYGSGAIGGVVNVVDQRIATRPQLGTNGSWGVAGDSAADRREANASLRAGNAYGDGAMMFSVDGFSRDSDDYSVPTFTNDEGETTDVVENSWVESIGGNLGLSYADEDGYFGVSYGQIRQKYGIPGHAHGHEDEHADEPHLAEEHADEEEAGPYADLRSGRWQALGGWNLGENAAIREVELKYGFTDYEHSEIEDGMPATTFTNEQHELRVSLRHQPLAGWDGAFGLHYFNQQQAAIGEEAYTPASDTERTGAFWVLEQTFGNTSWQLGARVEDVQVDTDFASDSYTPISASIGFVQQLSADWQVSANLAHAERAPSAGELYSNGAHFATRTYELGLAYELHLEDNGEYHIELGGDAPRLEKSNNLDLGLHYEHAGVHLQFNLFYNRVNDFIYAGFTGIDSELIHTDEAHDHQQEHADEAHEDEHDHGDEALPVVAYEQLDVDLYGYELDFGWDINEQWQWNAFSDFTRADARNGTDLPRTPGQRIGTDIRYLQNGWDATLGAIYYGAQNRVSVNETSTASYTLLNAGINFYPQWGVSQNLAIYVKAENLTDELGFVHTSFLKEDAPVRGRNFSLGISGSF